MQIGPLTISQHADCFDTDRQLEMGDKAFALLSAALDVTVEKSGTRTEHDLLDITLQERLEWISRLRTVALAMGVNSHVLIDFLCEKIRRGIEVQTESLGDEVLVHLAEVLGSFADFVGGPSSAECLLKPLELLCQVDETTVRLQAVRSITALGTTHLTHEQLFFSLVPIVVRLDLNTDSFWSCTSGCALVALAYEATVKCEGTLSLPLEPEELVALSLGSGDPTTVCNPRDDLPTATLRPCDPATLRAVLPLSSSLFASCRHAREGRCSHAHGHVSLEEGALSLSLTHAHPRALVNSL